MPGVGTDVQKHARCFLKHCGDLQTLFWCLIDGFETIIPLLTTTVGARARVRARLFAFWRGCWGTGQKHARWLLGRTFKSMPGFFSKHCGGLQTLCWCPIDAVETIIPLLTTMASKGARACTLVFFLARVLGDGSKACPLLGRTFKSMPDVFKALRKCTDAILLSYRRLLDDNTPPHHYGGCTSARACTLVCSCFLARVLGTQTVWGPTKRYLGLHWQAQ